MCHPPPDWIDNAGAKFSPAAAKEEAAIFRDVYSAATWTLPLLNDQVEP